MRSTLSQTRCSGPSRTACLPSEHSVAFWLCGKKRADPLVRPFSFRSLKRVPVLSGLASLWTSALSRSFTVFDHLIECCLCILHERRVRGTTIALRALLLSLIDGLRCFG